jgi:hypothetical protein
MTISLQATKKTDKMAEASSFCNFSAPIRAKFLFGGIP